MSITRFFIILCFSLATVQSKSTTDSTSIYLSPTIFFSNYQKMLNSFKIYIYTTTKPISFTSPAESRFFTSLQNSPFVTHNAEEAHLFFLPFSSDTSTRSLARLIRNVRMEFPYWNQTLGADHFYVSCSGLGYESDRNLLELKKNSIMVSCFPALEGRFVPHKDITLPPLTVPHTPANRTAMYLGFVKHDAVNDSTLVNNLTDDSNFLIESEPSDDGTLMERLESSKFCLLEYGSGISGLGDALRCGCVPVVITNRPIQDLPLMDVLTWQKMAVFVGSNSGVEEVKRACKDDTWNRMKGFSVASGQHFVWNEKPQPYDAFNMVMYQLWLRRHTIRYGRREWAA